MTKRSASASGQEESRFRRAAREYFESPLATIALVVFVLILLAALFAPWISPQNPYDPLEINFMDARLAPGSSASETDMTYWLGTDAQGRDMVSSILYGIRISLAVGVLSSFIAMLVGAALGLISSYLGGFFDALLMRIVEIQISLPSALVALVFIALFGRGVDRLIIALVLVQWAYFARTVRASALSEKNKEICGSRHLSGHAHMAHRLPVHLPQLSCPASGHRHHPDEPCHHS